MDDVWTADCHVRLGVDLISHGWDAVVLTALRGGPARRVDLRRAMGGAADKVLHAALLRLRSRGLVEQHERAYRLTPLGESFAHGPLLALARWAEANAAAVTADA